MSVSVLLPGLTDTPVLDQLGFRADAAPIKPMSVGQCVAEGLDALSANRATHIPGRINRVLNTVIPAGVFASVMGRMFGRLTQPSATVSTGEHR